MMRPRPGQDGRIVSADRREIVALLPTEECGSASVLVALWAVVVTALAGAAIVLGTLLAARESVSAAADLAALAGASASLTEPAQVCARAQAIAVANGAALERCRGSGTEVWVVVQAPVPSALHWLWPGRTAALSARAHAELTAELP